jgi:hypothetical protein
MSELFNTFDLEKAELEILYDVIENMMEGVQRATSAEGIPFTNLDADAYGTSLAELIASRASTLYSIINIQTNQHPREAPTVREVLMSAIQQSLGHPVAKPQAPSQFP